MRGAGLLAVSVAAMAGGAAAAAEYVAPPVMPVPGAWQGKAQAVVRVLDKLDTHVEVLTLPVNQTGSVGSLQVTPRSCLVRPDGLPADAGSLLNVRDAKATTEDFSGWMFAAEPSLGVFESPVYGVQLVGCAGADVAPMAPPLPPPAPPPPSMQVQPPPGDAGNGDAGDDGSDQGGAPPSDANGAPNPPQQLPDAGAQPDAVYPDGQPMPNPPAPGGDPGRRPAVPPPPPGALPPGQPVPDQPPPDQPDPDQAPPQLF